MEKPIRTRLHAVDAAIATVQRDPGSEPVHQLRVALRRLRAALRLSGKRERAGLDVAAHALLLAAGPARDVGVLLEWTRSTSDVTEAGLLPLQAQLAVELPLANGRLDVAMAIWRASQQWPVTPLDAGQALKKFRRHVKRLRHEMARVDRHISGPRAHELRGRVRELRYESEVMAEFDWQIPPQTLAHLADLQQRLGQIQDERVRLQRLRDVAVDKGQLRGLQGQYWLRRHAVARQIHKLADEDWLRALRELQPKRPF